MAGVTNNPTKEMGRKMCYFCSRIFLFLAFLNSHLTQNMNLSYQCLNAFTNIYVSIAVFGHIASYSKGCMPYEGECNIKCVNYNKNMYLPNKVCAY